MQAVSHIRERDINAWFIICQLPECALACSQMKSGVVATLGKHTHMEFRDPKKFLKSPVDFVKSYKVTVWILFSKSRFHESETTWHCVFSGCSTQIVKFILKHE